MTTDQVNQELQEAAEENYQEYIEEMSNVLEEAAESTKEQLEEIEEQKRAMGWLLAENDRLKEENRALKEHIANLEE